MVQRKGNPDYEAHSVVASDGVKTTVYKKKGGEKKKEGKGTPQKRRGGFKKPKENTGVLYALPSNTSSMASPELANQKKGREQTAAALGIQTDISLSGRALQAQQVKEGSKKPSKKAIKNSRPNPSSGGADGRA